ncbi:ABC transporter permease [Bacillus toyonensis]|uniref:ABC transporter permease n=1 Tax=Bacillus toyonensis TaxID=155322 RepID=UPI00069BF8E2|nr:ABC transporter permease subunit [Bacillus toyonensis]KNH38806.1 peptide ABC transporter permease [Bacillus thuringiensis]PEK39936.1 peptide ABC transporter permease [Bacillus toyonensis]HDR7512844.1 ABC transporter permease subunit [Bacillus toyonensis]HDR7702172.1 ABC transporter permease subunit [Bacillus toyonensis]
MWSYLKRDKRFWIGGLSLTILMILSIGNTIFNDGNIHKVILQYDKTGYPEVPPFPPSLQFLFGTDRAGYDLLNLIIEGAKWTIGFAILVAFLRMLLGIVIGFLLGAYVKRGFKKIEAFFDSFTIAPMVMICYFILSEVLIYTNGTIPAPFYQRILFQLGVIVLLSVPTLSLYVANEVRKLQTEEFVEAAKILGGGKLYIVIKHILPHLVPTFIIMLMQQFVQTLTLLLHLGLLNLFFGGTVLYGNEADSVTHEWTGLIGMYYPSLSSDTWIPMIPIIFFSLTVLAANKITDSVQESIEKKRAGSISVKNTNKSVLQVPENELFTFKHQA